MAGDQAAARRRPTHPKRRPSFTPSAVRGLPGQSREPAKVKRGETSLEEVSRRLLEDLAERFELGSLPPAAGSP